MLYLYSQEPLLYTHLLRTTIILNILKILVRCKRDVIASLTFVLNWQADTHSHAFL